MYETLSSFYAMKSRALKNDRIIHTNISTAKPFNTLAFFLIEFKMTRGKTLQRT